MDFYVLEHFPIPFAFLKLVYTTISASGAVSYHKRMGFPDARTMHEAAGVVIQSRFAATMSTAEWMALIQENTPASRETLYQPYFQAHRVFSIDF